MSIDRGRILPIRSISNMAGDNIAEVERASMIGLDAMYIDLEEPRAPFTEPDRRIVRKEIGDWLHSRTPTPGAPRYFVRVQGPTSGQTFKDAIAVMSPALAGLVIPKVEVPADIVAVDSLMTAIEEEQGLEVGSKAIYPILETAQGLRNAYHIACASRRVHYMGGAVSRFGDIVQAVGYRWTPEGTESFMFRSAALADCRAAGLPYPITGPSAHHTDDIVGLRRWAEEGRDLGYRGSQVRGLATHVAVMNEVYSPTADEVAYWRQLVSLADKADPGSSAPLRYGDPNQGEGYELHPAHIASARRGMQWVADLEAAAELRNADAGACALTTTKGPE